MKIIVVDDEALALQSLVRVLRQVFTNREINVFQKSREALAYVQKLHENDEKIEYAFLDIEMRGMNGIELAKCLKEICPTVRILFISAYDQYACEAFQLHAKGYILKPATSEMIEETLDSMEIDWRLEDEEIKKTQEENYDKPSIRVHTFGNFDIFVNDEQVKFERSKSKELLAYLIDRKGSGATTSEIAAVLWEEVKKSKKVANNTQQVIHSMMHTLKKAGIGDIIIKRWNYLAIDPSQLKCDYYQFLEGNIRAINAYMGEYMSQYSWAEMTTAALEQKKEKF